MKNELVSQKSVGKKGPFEVMSSMKFEILANNESNAYKFRRKVKKSRKSSILQGEKCGQCMKVDESSLIGAWTQIYGNPKTIKRNYGTLMSLENFHQNVEGLDTIKIDKTPVCIGLEGIYIYPKLLHN